MDNLDEQVFNMLEIIPERAEVSEKINSQLSIGGKRKRLIRLRKVDVDSLVEKFKELKKDKKEARLSVNRFKYYPVRSFFFHFLIVVKDVQTDASCTQKTYLISKNACDR